MSALTPDAARAAAEWLDTQDMPASALKFRAEADRMEDAARTPGQVAYEATYAGFPWCNVSPIERTRWECIALAVIAHHACLTPWPAGLTADDVELCARYGAGLSAASDDEIMAAGNRVLSALR